MFIYRPLVECMGLMVLLSLTRSSYTFVGRSMIIGGSMKVSAPGVVSRGVN